MMTNDLNVSLFTLTLTAYLIYTNGWPCKQIYLSLSRASFTAFRGIELLLRGSVNLRLVVAMPLAGLAYLQLYLGLCMLHVMRSGWSFVDTRHKDIVQFLCHSDLSAL